MSVVTIASMGVTTPCVTIRESVDYVGMASTRPLSLNKCIKRLRTLERGSYKPF